MHSTDMINTFHYIRRVGKVWLVAATGICYVMTIKGILLLAEAFFVANILN